VPTGNKVAVAVGLAALLGAYLFVRSRRTQLTGAGEVDEITVTAERIAPPTVPGFLDVVASKVGALLMTRGYRNNNPGNIRYIANARRAWRGQIADDKGYGVYDTPANGTRALGHQLEAYARRGLVTVRSIISTWAPSNENDTNAYIAHVSSDLSVDPDDSLDVRARLPKIARAIAKHENGYVDTSYDFETWVYLP
jgi:hypothetical protein